MTGTILHDHKPIFRVVRREWADPLDATYSQTVDNRWNTARFPALYCCCSQTVARAIVRNVFRLTGADLADLQETRQPQLIEIDWSGEPIDMISESAILTAGFAADYPRHSSHAETQVSADQWHTAGAPGVLCRSHSRSRFGFSDWSGHHAAWSELAIFTDTSPVRPSLLRRHADMEWLQPV